MDAEATADALTARTLQEFLAAHPALEAPAAAADEAPPSAESADAGVRVLRSLRETEAAAWTQLEAFGGHPRQLELATAVCEQMQQEEGALTEAEQRC